MSLKTLSIIVGLFIGCVNAQGSSENPAVETDTMEPYTSPHPTSTIPTTTLPPPTANPSEKPDTGKWNYTDDKNTTCIILHMGIQLKFDYKTANSSQTVYYDVPTDAKVSGDCNVSATTQRIDLHFFTDWQLAFVFEKTGKQYSIANVTLNFSADKSYFPDIANETAETCNTSKFGVSDVASDKSYQCQSETTVTDFAAGVWANLTQMRTWEMRTQAFQNTTKFNDAVYCTADTKVSNLVPIIVGAALAGLVLVVLIAYLIGRTRNKRGYESV